MALDLAEAGSSKGVMALGARRAFSETLSRRLMMSP